MPLLLDFSCIFPTEIFSLFAMKDHVASIPLFAPKMGNVGSLLLYRKEQQQDQLVIHSSEFDLTFWIQLSTMLGDLSDCWNRLFYLGSNNTYVPLSRLLKRNQETGKEHLVLSPCIEERPLHINIDEQFLVFK